MTKFNEFYHQIALTPLAKWLEILPAQLSLWEKNNEFNRIFYKCNQIIKQLPLLIPQKLDLLHGIYAQKYNDICTHQLKNIERLLINLNPWRKGPYFIDTIEINAEWRSNLKWQRLFPYISPLSGRTILDVGCGNGYYMWRMIGAGAKLIIGLEPMQLLFYQFEAIRKLLGNERRLHLLPLRISQLPALQAFDTVFSMGVIYHCRSPFDHLLQLKNQLKYEGELILETLVIDENQNNILVPTKSYAKMKNVYFIPSVSELKKWLHRCGFINIRVIDINQTSMDEQRRTKWMNRESLADFLDFNDSSKTIEGYPAPLRAILVMNK
ncbi:tRNA 5-methoxyuridine(34)/uridine 5-oxyacetic acid(34) synthase CmoB [Pantoea sp. Mhis]|uniref:tRNA 5-methoxyuridine(34)/uridine 5-oxyacetic acid(34) synthase CmoB n=1 Tax=Pantoea sp. Mhis TaxID=2576759 RepID=UPI00135AC620|nr:tRNA 5-methoxyuridine(34)/uridine 5-oxyacetic acid(34) synthase CmoB [Pantoea sp. Mhis]MXP56176.1 tRNA 5-methoxyuridine(34)/uridine 5-oxyacetic acid(34) synthase CmoB [Pantoea sp. Mhis]